MKSIKYFSIIFIAFSAFFCRGAEVAQRPTSPTVVDWSDKVVKQEGATCGFHAVKNAVYLHRHLISDLDRHILLTYLKASENSCAFPLAIWQSYVGTRDNLDEAAINTLLGRIGINRTAITVIPDVHSFEPSRLMFNQTEQLANFLHNLRVGNPCVHAFVLGNMNEAYQAYGHWVAVVVYANGSGKIAYHYADSVGENQAGRDHFLGSLQAKVLAVEGDKLRVEACLAGCMSGAETLIKRDSHNKPSDYRNALRLLREAYQRMVTSHLEESPLFITEYLPRIKVLAETINTISSVDATAFVARLTSLKDSFAQQREQERKIAKDAKLQEQAEKEMEELFDEDLAWFMGVVQDVNRQQVAQEHARLLLEEHARLLLERWGHTTERIAAIENARNNR